uniref:Uncharacterized protein n=1 Tax=Romanomermis culicivorax TaxID=13658 RepID=A0A915IAY2_ROMCU
MRMCPRSHRSVNKWQLHTLPYITDWRQQLHISLTTLINLCQQLHTLLTQLHESECTEKPLYH